MQQYQKIFLLFAFFLFTCATCGQKKVAEQAKETKESPEAQRKKLIQQKFAKKWIIKKHYHPGSIDEGDTAPEGEYIHLKTDGTYEMNTYGYKETGTWEIPTPRPQRYEAMGMNMPLQEEEELLELTPKKTGVRQERTYILKIEGNKLMLIATFDPTSLEAAVE